MGKFVNLMQLKSGKENEIMFLSRLSGNHTAPASSVVSLANFLMTFDMTFDDFMKKCDKWVNMSTANVDRMIGVLRDHHHAYTVSKIMYRTFDDVFWRLFTDPSVPVTNAAVESRLNEAKNANAKKKTTPASESKNKPTTSEDLFQFTWGLFCFGRREHGQMKDLVASNALLLTCVEQVVQDAVDGGCGHLLNADCDLFPGGWDRQSELPDLLERLCERFQTNVSEARGLKVDWLMPRLTTMLVSAECRIDLTRIVANST